VNKFITAVQSLRVKDACLYQPEQWRSDLVTSPVV